MCYHASVREPELFKCSSMALFELLLYRNMQLTALKNAGICIRWDQEGTGYFKSVDSGKVADKPSSGEIHIAANGAADAAKSPADSYKTFLPFSDGPRSCIGQVSAFSSWQFSM